MKMMLLPALAAGSVLVSLLGLPLAQGKGQDPQPPSPAEIQQMMEKAKQYTQPGKNHDALKRFIGKWRIQLRLTMGGQDSKPEGGTAEFSWLMPGRWLRGEGSGSMMGMPLQSFWVLGYDNFKQSFVATSVTSMDTAMLRSEGDLTQDGSTLITYGTLDEYLTGEHDKMVKYVWRFVGDDKIVHEVHDLPIGEQGTKVVEVVYERMK